MQGSANWRDSGVAPAQTERPAQAERQDAHVTTPVPETHYARTPDGASLAYHTYRC